MTDAKRIRVLVVDDSAFARRVMREVLSSDDRIEVIGYARDGLDALEKIDELSPDVITLDLVMPELDGVGVLDALRSRPDAPRAIVCSISPADSPLAVAALTAGAFDLVTKPTALATDALYEVRGSLVAKVVMAGAARSFVAGAAPPAPREPVPPPRASTRRLEVPTTSRIKLVVIGASTGGPRAVSDLLAALPASFPTPVAIVVHMPEGYTEAFAARLDRDSPLRVVEGTDGTALQPGVVVLARAGVHLCISRRGEHGFAGQNAMPSDALHRPSVDALFTSAAHAFGDAVLGVVLTGMGTDGLEGARALVKAGSTVITEAASSCVVYGMPRAVFEAGLSSAAIPMDQMAEAIASRLK